MFQSGYSYPGSLGSVVGMCVTQDKIDNGTLIWWNESDII
jgi:hypothetical protein